MHQMSHLIFMQRKKYTSSHIYGVISHTQSSIFYMFLQTAFSLKRCVVIEVLMKANTAENLSLIFIF